jgi:hypothetical protein
MSSSNNAIYVEDDISKYERFSILPILTLNNIITYNIVPGSVTSERFL